MHNTSDNYAYRKDDEFLINSSNHYNQLEEKLKKYWTM